MGVVIAFEVAARHHGLPGAVVAVDSPICPQDAVREAIQPVIDGVKTPSFRQVSQDFVGYRARFLLGLSSAGICQVVAAGVCQLWRSGRPTSSSGV